MQNDVEIFETRRDFNKLFHGLFTCFSCGALTPNPYVCSVCGTQANQFFADTFNFIIKSETNEIQRIFKPIEIIEEEQQCQNKIYLMSNYRKKKKN